VSRPRLLLIDPDDTRRQRFQAYLVSQFEVLAIPVAARSHERFTSLKPDAVLAHARQPGSSGPRICRELRDLAGGEDCLMVVYGHLVGPRRTPAQCEQMRVETRVDIWLTREVDAIDLEKVLGLKLLAPEEAPKVAAPPDARKATPKVEFISAHRESTGDDPSWGTAAPSSEDRGSFLAGMGKRYGPLIQKLPKDQDVTWGQLLRARANLHNLQVLLEKPVTPLIQELPEDRPLSVAEILRARVTLRNLRIILRRRLPGAPAEAQEPPIEEAPPG
jgi:CheY-like chemotaxis protein